jgi:hypothetical protein
LEGFFGNEGAGLPTLLSLRGSLGGAFLGPDPDFAVLKGGRTEEAEGFGAAIDDRRLVSLCSVAEDVSTLFLDAGIPDLRWVFMLMVP